MDKIKELFKKFMGIYGLLPWGNNGRGTRVYLWPFVTVSIFVLLTMVHAHYAYTS